jgi:hypothetical protein
MDEQEGIGWLPMAEIKDAFASLAPCLTHGLLVDERAAIVRLRAPLGKR